MFKDSTLQWFSHLSKKVREMHVFNIKDRFSKNQAWWNTPFNLSTLEAQIGRSLCIQEGRGGGGFTIAFFFFF